jgi:hypothetical protein
VNALIRIDADFACPGESGRRTGLQPPSEEITRQPFPRFELDHFAKPGLRHIEDQKAAGNGCEDQELVEKRENISLSNRFVKRPVPGIEADLGRGGRADYKNRPDNEQPETAPSWGKPKGDEEFAELMNQAAYPFFNRFGILQGLFPRFSFLDATSVVFAGPAAPRERAPPLPLANTGCTASRDWLIARSINAPIGKALVARAIDAPAGAPVADRPEDEGTNDVEHQTNLHVPAKLISRRRGRAQPIVPRANCAS